DLRSGEIVLRRGAVLRAAEIGVLASIGRARVTVHRRPNVAVLSTGDELVDIIEQPAPGKIRDTNRYSLSAAVRATGSAAFERGVYDRDAETVRATGPQGSGILRSLSLANCLIDIPEPLASVEPGTDVTVVLTDLPEDH